jgi:serine/threonine protein kinase
MRSALVLEPGTTVGGKYRLVRRIGVGGMGEVWIAKNRMTAADVAVKMGLGAAAQEDAALRFRHEARLGGTLAHRSIIRIFDLVEENDGTLILVMELLKGETLERHLRRQGPLPMPTAVAIAIPILSALAHAHENGIVHRDVTPANIFLAVDPDGHVTPKLLDFGIAKIPADAPVQTIAGRVLGTPRYMAPERIRDQDIDGRSDLFSVGVILYEMLTGVCPFAAGSPAASLAAVLETVVDIDPRIEPRLWVHLRQALAKHPYERPPTATAMANSLLAATGEAEGSLADVLREARFSRDLGHEDTGPFDPTQSAGAHSLSGARARLPLQRRRVVAWTMAALAACAGLATAVAAVQREDPTGARPAPNEQASVPVPTVVLVDAALAASATAPSAPAPWVSPEPASATPSMTKVPALRIRRARPKPVATTPGF